MGNAHMIFHNHIYQGGRIMSSPTPMFPLINGEYILPSLTHISRGYTYVLSETCVHLARANEYFTLNNPYINGSKIAQNPKKWIAHLP